MNPIAESISDYNSEIVINKKNSDFNELSALKISESDDIIINEKRAFTINNINLEKVNGKKMTINLSKFPLFDKGR